MSENVTRTVLNDLKTGFKVSGAFAAVFALNALADSASRAVSARSEKSAVEAVEVVPMAPAIPLNCETRSEVVDGELYDVQICIGNFYRDGETAEMPRDEFLEAFPPEGFTELPPQE